MQLQLRYDFICVKQYILFWLGYEQSIFTQKKQSDELIDYYTN